MGFLDLGFGLLRLLPSLRDHGSGETEHNMMALFDLGVLEGFEAVELKGFVEINEDFRASIDWYLLLLG